MILAWSSSKIVQRNYFHAELWLPLQPNRKNLELLLGTNRKSRSLAIQYVALSSGLLARLSKSCPWGQNWSHPGDQRFSIEIYSKTCKHLIKFKSPRAQIHGMQNCLVDFQKVCSNHSTRVKIGTSYVLHRFIQGKTSKNLLGTNQKPSSLEILYLPLSSGLLQSLFQSQPHG